MSPTSATKKRLLNAFAKSQMNGELTMNFVRKIRKQKSVRSENRQWLEAKLLNMARKKLQRILGK